MDEAPIGDGELQFVAQLPHVYIDGAIVLAECAAPDGDVELRAAQDPPLPAHQRIEEGELPDRQRDRLFVDPCDELVWPDVEDHDGRFAACHAFPVKGPQPACKQPVNAAPPRRNSPYTSKCMDRLRLAVIDADSGF